MVAPRTISVVLPPAGPCRVPPAGGRPLAIPSACCLPGRRGSHFERRASPRPRCYSATWAAGPFSNPVQVAFQARPVRFPVVVKTLEPLVFTRRSCRSRCPSLPPRTYRPAAPRREGLAYADVQFDERWPSSMVSFPPAHGVSAFMARFIRICSTCPASAVPGPLGSGCVAVPRLPRSVPHKSCSARPRPR